MSFVINDKNTSIANENINNDTDIGTKKSKKNKTTKSLLLTKIKILKYKEQSSPEINHIIKLDNTKEKLYNNMNIEYSKDKTTLVRLFDIKNYLKIKKKTFI